MKDVDIFLTISARSPGKQRRGWYRYIMTCKGGTTEGKDYIKKVTGNQLIIHCAIEALKRMTQPSVITIHTESNYLINGWKNLTAWKKNGWRRSDGKALKNTELWIELEELAQPHAVRFHFEPMYPYTESDFS